MSRAVEKEAELSRDARWVLTVSFKYINCHNVGKERSSEEDSRMRGTDRAATVIALMIVDHQCNNPPQP